MHFNCFCIYMLTVNDKTIIELGYPQISCIPLIIDFPADMTEEFVQVFQDDPRIARLVIMQGQFAGTIWV